MTKQESGIIEERNQIYWNICFFGDKITKPLLLKVQTRSTLEQKMIDAHKKWTIPYKKKMTISLLQEKRKKIV